MQRRSLLQAAVTWGGVAFLGRVAVVAEQMAVATCDQRPLGDLVELVPLHGDRPRPTPFAQIVGGPGLDARMFTDLSRLQPDRLVTPTAEVFIRTAASQAQAAPSWPITLRGCTRPDARLTSDALRHDAAPMGAHLSECSGNADPDNFGLMSVAEWDGVPLAQLVEQ